MQLKFWTSFRDRMVGKGQRAPKPSAQSWQSFRVGRTGFSLEGVVQRTSQQLLVRLYINCEDLPPKGVFRYLLAKQDLIHTQLGIPLVWNELPEQKGCVLAVAHPNCPLEDETRWNEYQDWIEFTIAKMDAVFRPLIKPLQLSDLPEVPVVALEIQEPHDIDGSVTQ